MKHNKGQKSVYQGKILYWQHFISLGELNFFKTFNVLLKHINVLNIIIIYKFLGLEDLKLC